MEWLLPVVDRLLRRLVLLLVIVRLCVRFKVLIEPTLAAVCGASQHLAEPGEGGKLQQFISVSNKAGL